LSCALSILKVLPLFSLSLFLSEQRERLG